MQKPSFISCNCRFGNVNRISTIVVQAEINELGNVSKATAVSGHPILKLASEKAARKSKFTPSRISYEAVKAKAFIIYTFLIVDKWSVKSANITVKDIQVENKSTN